MVCYTMSGIPQTEALDVLADSHARCILRRTSQTPMSAQELAAVCEMSETTIYRRLNQLQNLGFLTEHVELDRSGDHQRRYETAIDYIGVSFTDGELAVTIEPSDESSDHLSTTTGGRHGGRS